VKYRGTSAEYARFSKAMNLPQQRERVTVDGLGNIGVGKYKSTSNAGVPLKTVEKFYKIVIIKAGKQSLD
jgi:glutamate dehydrogenase/leucine dehydrogenase